MKKRLRAAATVNLSEKSYPIYVAEGLLEKLEEIIDEELDEVTGCVVVTSQVLNVLYGSMVLDALNGLDPKMVIIPDGEKAKSWTQAGKLIGEFISNGLDRKGVVVAFGGGTVGDLAGFAAAIYLRGVRVIQVPTTLLGQTDSSIGGKTAVNHMKGKNLIGAFHQPSIVVSDTSLLHSLPLREIASGLAEVIKYGVIADETLFRFLEEHGGNMLEGKTAELTHAVKRSAEIKAIYVERDEKESSGVRAMLNYGHTAGHAIEKTATQVMRHGEAVAIGMMVAGRIACMLGLFTENELERQGELLTSIGLATRVPRMDVSRVLEVMSRDKKARDGRIQFVLPTGIGSEPVLRVIPEPLIVKALEESMDG